MRSCTNSKCAQSNPQSMNCFHKNKKRCKKCRNEEKRFYRQKNKKKVNEYNSLWSKNNPDKIAKACKKYKTKNSAKINAINGKRHAAKLQRTPKWLTSLHYSQIEMFYSAAVALTKEFGIPMEVDHIVPLQGKNVSGLHVPWNLQVITASMNSGKRNKF